MKWLTSQKNIIDKLHLRIENLTKPATTGKSELVIKVCPPKGHRARQFSKHTCIKLSQKRSSFSHSNFFENIKRKLKSPRSLLHKAGITLGIKTG